MPNCYMVSQSEILKCKHYVIILFKIKIKLLLIFYLHGTVKEPIVTAQFRHLPDNKKHTHKGKFTLTLTYTNINNEHILMFRSLTSFLGFLGMKSDILVNFNTDCN
jgi:hypothetical protein